MTDLERELKTVFDRKVGGLGIVPIEPPPRLLRRIRLRQAAAALTVLAVIAGLVVGSLVSVRALTGGARHPAGITKEPTTSFTSGGVTLSYPHGWQAVSLVSGRALYVGRPDVTSVLPILQLTNFSTVSSGGPICPDRPGPPGSFPSWGVLVYVEQDMAFPGVTPSSAAWPVRAAPSEPDPVPSDVCLHGAERIRWHAAGRILEARMLAGPDASVADKAKLVSSFESMGFRPLDWPEEHSGRLVVPLGPTVTITQGEVAGDPWTLFGEPADVGTCLHLEFAAGTELSGYGCAFLADAINVNLPQETTSLETDPFRRSGATDVEFVYGAVVPEGVRVVADLDDGRTVEAATRPVPFNPSIRAFVVPITKTNRAIHATITVFDASGRVLVRVKVELGPSGV